MRQEFQKPAWMNDWKVFLIFSLISFAFAFGLRCLDLPKWSDPSFMVHGEYIMGTHDAYYWLAGAKGVGSAVGNPMSELIRFLGSLTGIQYGNIAFWLPAVFAGFCAIAAFSWGMLVRGPWVGLVSAIYATSIPAYYFRTRLSYYDTDVVTLFFPLLISVLLARWVSQGIRTSWLPQKGKEIEFNPTLTDYCLPILAGAIAAYGKLWHSDVLTFGIMVALIAIGLSVVCGTKNNRSELLRGLVLFFLVAFVGWFGLVLAVLFLIVLSFPAVRKHKFYNNTYLYLLILLAIFVLSGLGQDLIAVISDKISAYIKPVADISSDISGPQYPGIAQSVIEAQNISFDALFANLTGSTLLGWLGFLSFVFVVLVRPNSIFLAPFAAITFAAVYMGGRFAMFGGIALGLGLSFALACFIERYANFTTNKLVLGVVQSLVMVGLLFSNIMPMYEGAPATPIMGQSHAKALIEAGKKMPNNSTVWTWWDWGYATMYYSGVNSFANGGNHAGRTLYPLAFVYTTPSCAQANQMIKFSAVNKNNPANVWDKMSGKDVEKMISSFADVNYNFKPKGKQYIVVTWENLRLAYWILYYGSWDTSIGGGAHPVQSLITTPFTLQGETGVIDIENEGKVDLSGYIILDKSGTKSKFFPANNGPTLVYNSVVRQGFMVDKMETRSMLLKLLIGNPQDKSISSFFKVVYEDFPSVRVLEVL
ncbi:STT3 domain-containing protein [Desulfovibrio gilichinskyi]|uniref:Dolichyl-diphosphooligosaccharide--protein glycosyltransferase n=1 Tax=Desulfovibrio gilichinskyi TaxID=1519643 RepID=A0A1X7EI15_9BACT|nr:STT3 domain-containing protein [Desulfovibrio gilichinskyi]SMF33866.1 dolichyl-diphosphooligosaccharide--protein glycosyltransferase [Desulfovibrio gilichinskyi]